MHADRKLCCLSSIINDNDDDDNDNKYIQDHKDDRARAQVGTKFSYEARSADRRDGEMETFRGITGAANCKGRKNFRGSGKTDD
jgi:hypothetical protein